MMNKAVIPVLAAALSCCFSSCSDIMTNGCNTEPPEFLVYASIDSDAGTKMSYAASSGKLKQSWSEGDRIVGYSKNGSYVFQFKEYSSGKAVFSYEGETSPENGDLLHMVYAPGYDSFGLSLTADIMEQSQDAVPAFLYASGTVADGRLDLSFRNEMAIVAVVDPTFDYLAGDSLLNVKIEGSNIIDYAVLSAVTGDLAVTPIARYKYVETSCALKIDSKGKTSGTVYLALFPNSTAADLTFTLTTSAKAYQFTIPDKSLVAGKCYTVSPAYAKEIPDGARPGEFSVSETGKVRFSQGNLRYTVATGKWSFFDNQWDCDCGTADAYLPDLLAPSGTEISLFAWGYTSKSTDPYDATGIGGLALSSGDLSSSQDWGCVFGTSSVWRTLTYDEWDYLLRRERSDGKDCVKFAQVPVTSNLTVKGVILMPDEWDGTPVLDEYTLTYEKWQQLVFKGAVFLPASNSRNGKSYILVDSNFPECHYWTSTAGSYTTALSFDCNSSTVAVSKTSAANRSLGYSVRLVADVE